MKHLNLSVLRLGAAAAIAAMGLCAAAQADFVLQTPVVKTPSVPANSSASKLNGRKQLALDAFVTSRISQTGDAPSTLPIIRGQGRDVTLIDALKQILPPGWKVFADDKVDSNVFVSWAGTRTWVMILHGILVDTNMKAEINWADLELSLTPGPVVLATVASAASTMTDATGGPVAANKLAAPVAAPAPMPEWVLKSGMNLSDNLQMWATTAGWRLVWSAYAGNRKIDYPIDEEVVFKAKFEGVDGAVGRVVAALDGYNATYPLEVEFFSANKVVEIRLRKNSLAPTAAAQ